MKKTLIIIGIIVLIAAGAGVFVWQRSAKPVAYTPDVSNNQTKDTPSLTVEELEKLIAKTQKEIAEKQVEVDSIVKEEVAGRRRLSIITAENISEDVPVEGVEIVKTGDKKIIKNRAQGYSIEMPTNLILARSTNSERLDLYQPTRECTIDCNPDISIEVETGNIDEAPFNEMLVETSKQTIEKLVIQGVVVYKLHSFAPELNVDDYAYFFGGKQKVYSINVDQSDDQEYRSFIETFKLE